VNNYFVSGIIFSLISVRNLDLRMDHIYNWYILHKIHCKTLGCHHNQVSHKTAPVNSSAVPSCCLRESRYGTPSLYSNIAHTAFLL
jgi:hypothetical protein